MKNLTFGIEIELTGISRERAAQAVAQHFGTSAHYLGGGYDKWIASDNQGRSWFIMNDSSISPETRQNGTRTAAGLDHRLELVSPICTYQDIETVQEVTRVLRRAGAFANKTCGLHLHVGKERFTAKTLRNLVNIVASKEDLIYQALQVDEARERRYCQKVNQSFLEELNRQKPTELDELADLWYKGYNDRRSSKYHPSRYHGANLHAVFHGPTIEYRFYVQKNVMCSYC